MNELNNRIKDIPIPIRMRSLPISDEGYPVPWFVPWIDNKPEFRGFDGRKMQQAVAYKRCWLCGDPLGKYMTFVIGPMCMVNRNTAEPPCHHGCAEYAVKACPFLTQPRMRRNEKDIPENRGAAGVMIKRNPGVTIMWTCCAYRTNRRIDGILFQLDEPTEIEAYTEGRAATRAEVLYSMNSGLPILQQYAREEGPESVLLLEKMYNAALGLLLSNM